MNNETSNDEEELNTNA